MNKKGFTLVELLAVIIILGALAVIITPRITNTLKEAEQKTNMTSAQNLIKAVEYKIADKEITGLNENIVIDYGNNTNTNYLDYTGAKPEEGIVKIKKDGKVAMAVKIGDSCYLKSFNSNDITTEPFDEETCNSESEVFTTIAIGDSISYGQGETQEHFKVIKIFTEDGVEKAMLFADYGLKKDTTTTPATYYQDANSPDPISFCNCLDKAYWMEEIFVLKSEYSNNGEYSYDAENSVIVDENGVETYIHIYDSNSNTYDYVEGYLTTLKTGNYGLPSSATARLLFYEEATDTNIFPNSDSLNIEKKYWLGSANDNRYVADISYDGTLNGYILTSTSTNDPVVRPVIIIPTDEF